MYLGRNLWASPYVLNNMIDVTRRFNAAMRNARHGIGIAPVRVYTPKRYSTIPQPTDEKVVERPMSLRQIKKLDPKGCRADTKEFPEMKDEKIKNFWAYTSVKNKSSQRMSRVKVKVNLSDILAMRGAK